MSSLDEAINCLFICLIFVILSAIFDLYDILINGLSIHNNANKAFMFLLIFSGFVLISEGINNEKSFFSRCKIIFGFLILFFSFIDLLLNSILDFKEFNFSFIMIIKPIGYSIGIIFSFLIIKEKLKY